MFSRVSVAVRCYRYLGPGGQGTRQPTMLAASYTVKNGLARRPTSPTQRNTRLFHHNAVHLGGPVSSVFLKPMEAVLWPWGESSQRAPLPQALLAAWVPPPSCAHPAAPLARPRGSQLVPSLSVRGTLMSCSVLSTSQTSVRRILPTALHTGHSDATLPVKKPRRTSPRPPIGQLTWAELNPGRLAPEVCSWPSSLPLLQKSQPTEPTIPCRFRQVEEKGQRAQASARPRAACSGRARLHLGGEPRPPVH